MIGELEICPSFGWQGGPEFSTLIKTLRSGRERRRPLWDIVRHRYSLPFQNIRRSEQYEELKRIFLACRGSAYPFFVIDRSDYAAENEQFAIGDGAETDFDLSITYPFGDYEYVRPIYHPRGATYTVNGVPATATYNETTRKVEFAVAPADLSVIRWSGEFRTLVRFSNDTLPMSIDNRSGADFVMNGSVDLWEVLE